jgi:hypothetical protein
MTLVDIGTGTGAFAAAFSAWFNLSVLAAELSVTSGYEAAARRVSLACCASAASTVPSSR